MMAFRLLLVVVLLLAGCLAWLWVDETGQVRSQTWQPPAPLLPEFQPVATADASAPANPVQFLAVLDRPLFAPDRRPPPPPEAVAAEAPPPDPFANITLYGVYGSKDAGGVLARVNDRLRRVRTQETLGDWTLQSIEGREATFARGEETRVLRLAVNHGPRPALAAGGAAPPAGGAVPLDRLAMQQQAMDEARERLRQRNELFRKAGLPPPKE